MYRYIYIALAFVVVVSVCSYLSELVASVLYSVVHVHRHIHTQIHIHMHIHMQSAQIQGIAAMVHRRRWLQLFPVVSLRELEIYSDLLIRIFSANPGISASSLHCFLLSAYGVNISEDELQTWLYSCLMNGTECFGPMTSF